MADWHEFFKRAWENAEDPDALGGFGRILHHYKETFRAAVEMVHEQGVDERDALLYVLDISEGSDAPMRLLETWARDMWPHLFDDEEE
jgi:hypothetical protein